MKDEKAMDSKIYFSLFGGGGGLNTFFLKFDVDFLDHF